MYISVTFNFRPEKIGKRRICNWILTLRKYILEVPFKLEQHWLVMLMLKLYTGTRKTMANTNVFTTLNYFRHRPYSKNVLIHMPATPHRIDIIKSFETS